MFGNIIDWDKHRKLPDSYLRDAECLDVTKEDGEWRWLWIPNYPHPCPRPHQQFLFSD
jgi:hypothetical protein